MIEDTRPPLIVLTGPTAVGKTALSIDLAKAIRGEIISADSMQVYKYMDIGSAKVTPEEMQGVPHYLIDYCEPWEEFHVVRFQQDARAALRQIYSHGNIPIIAGGTGFYIQALTREIDFTSHGEDSSLRKELERRMEAGEEEALHRELAAVDPASAQIIHPANHKRVIRALEYYYQSGEPISEHNKAERERPTPYNLLYLVLNRDREELYRRINLRVDQMLEAGLVEEVQRLKEMGCHRGMISMQGLGYKEILSYLEGECTLEEAVRVLKRDTRHFAKRQLTWFRREGEVIWLNWEEYPTHEKMLEHILDLCRSHSIEARVPLTAEMKSNQV